MIPPPGDIILRAPAGAKGLGHAVWCARHLIGDEPVAVLLPDDLILRKRPACSR
jgi:UTP--glucose-1-phosphate uridylyltransferase